MLLELVIFNFIFTFVPLYHAVFVQVIWVTGISMILLAALIYLPLPVLFAIGLITVAGHNMLDTFNSRYMPDTPVWWEFLHQQYFVEYCLIACLAYFILYCRGRVLCCSGICLGSLFVPGFDGAKRRRQLVWMGSLAMLVFILLRWANVYGDLVPWA